METKKFNQRENLVQISAKVNKSTLESIDRIAKQRPYCKRNAIINRLLFIFLRDITDSQVYNIIADSYHKHPAIKLEIVEIHE